MYGSLGLLGTGRCLLSPSAKCRSNIAGVLYFYVTMVILRGLGEEVKMRFTFQSNIVHAPSHTLRGTPLHPPSNSPKRGKMPTHWMHYVKEQAHSRVKAPSKCEKNGDDGEVKAARPPKILMIILSL